MFVGHQLTPPEELIRIFRAPAEPSRGAGHGLKDVGLLIEALTIASAQGTGVWWHADVCGWGPGRWTCGSMMPCSVWSCSGAGKS